MHREVSKRRKRMEVRVPIMLSPEISLKFVQDNDASFLASIVSSPGPQAGPSRPDFRIHYDQETPLRSIDVGGPDQQKRRVLTSMTHSKSLY